MFSATRVKRVGKRWMHLCDALLLSMIGVKIQFPKVVIISETGHGRLLKIARALNIGGIYPVLITKNPDFSRYNLFDKVHVCTSHFHALQIAFKFYKGSCFHVITNWNYSLVFLMIILKVGKIFIDPLDVLNYFVKPKIKNKYLLQFMLEKWCIENSNGLVCRDLRTNLLKKKHWNLPVRILFMDYINKPKQEFKNKVLGRDIVYVGNVELDPNNNVAYQYGLAKILQANRIDFSIYPSWQGAAEQLRLIFKTIYQEKNAEISIQIHDTVSVDKLPSRIVTSSYGLLISTTAIDYGDIHDTYYQITGRYFFAGKIFDYYESQVFPITQKGMFLSFIMRRMGVGTSVNSYQEIVNFLNENENKHITFNYNKNLTIEHNASRLSSFYRGYL